MFQCRGTNFRISPPPTRDPARGQPPPGACPGGIAPCPFSDAPGLTYYMDDPSSGTIFRLPSNEYFFLQTNRFVHRAGQTVHVSCHGPNYADANADFATKCLYQNKYKFNIQLRVAETVSQEKKQVSLAWTFLTPKQDYKSYALLTSCAGPDPHGNYFEAFGILAAKKTGVDPAVRQRIVKRVVAAGWNPAWIRRIPSQKDC